MDTPSSTDPDDRFVPPNPRIRIGGVVAVVTGAVLLGASGFAVWLEVLGSELTGFRLSELIGGFGEKLSSVPPPWVGAVWHLFPVSAGVSWFLVFRRSPPAASLIHVVLGAAAAIGAGLYLGLVDVQLGPALALVGGWLILAGGILGRVGKALD